MSSSVVAFKNLGRGVFQPFPSRAKGCAIDPPAAGARGPAHFMPSR